MRYEMRTRRGTRTRSPSGNRHTPASPFKRMDHMRWHRCLGLSHESQYISTRIRGRRIRQSCDVPSESRLLLVVVITKFVPRLGSGSPHRHLTFTLSQALCCRSRSVHSYKPCSASINPRSTSSTNPRHGVGMGDRPNLRLYLISPRTLSRSAIPTATMWKTPNSTALCDSSRTARSLPRPQIAL